MLKQAPIIPLHTLRLQRLKESMKTAINALYQKGFYYYCQLLAISYLAIQVLLQYRVLILQVGD